jgi:hypothetical protein
MWAVRPLRLPLLPLLALAGLLSPALHGGPGAARAEEDAGEEWADFARAPDPTTAAGPDADLFRRALALQAEGRYRAARRAFWTLLDEHADSPFAPEARDRSSENAFLGTTLMNEPRPSARRIDVALMGDGYLLDHQARFDKDADGHLKVLLREPAFQAYEPYFNWWRFNLASAETGVDEVEPPPPDEELEERRRKRPRRVRTYSTALDCKAAGPQGQVMADPRRVWHYLSYLDVNDALAICFAKKGSLGMGGMGIATTGPKGVVVHEFGHAFSGLLDEYAVNPGEPYGQVSAANATTDRRNPPWRHFLDARYPGVGVYEGGATFQSGVWRPAASCAMNIGGSQFCPVCREATVLMIYTYVSPIDLVRPAEAVLAPAADGAWPEVLVVPMAPATHALDVSFWLGAAPPVTEERPPPPEEPFDPFLSEEEREMLERIRRRGGWTPEAPPPAPEPIRPSTPHKPGTVRRSAGTALLPPPVGREIRARRAKGPDGTEWRAQIPAGLAPGRYVLTALVRDPAKPRGERHPWVLKDDRGLLEDRHVWTFEVPAPGRE